MISVHWLNLINFYIPVSVLTLNLRGALLYVHA